MGLSLLKDHLLGQTSKVVISFESDTKLAIILIDSKEVFKFSPESDFIK